MLWQFSKSLRSILENSRPPYDSLVCANIFFFCFDFANRMNLAQSTDGRAGNRTDGQAIVYMIVNII